MWAPLQLLFIEHLLQASQLGNTFMLPRFILSITYQGRYLFFKFFITYLFFFCVACEVLVPLPGIESVFPAVEAQCLN